MQRVVQSRMMRSRLLSALTIVLLLASSAAHASAERLASLSQALVGQWKIVSPDEPRYRIWDVRRVRAYEPRLYLVEGTYGFWDGNWTPIVAELHDAAAGAAIVLPTPVNNTIELTIGSEGKLSGTFQLRTRKVTVSAEKLPQDQRISKEAHPAATALEGPSREAVWTAQMSSFQTGQSSSTIQAPLPPNLVIRPPHADVLQKWARFSGRWSGWACYFGGLLACDVRLAVLTIYGDRADIVHTWGDSSMKSPSTTRTVGRFVGDELHITFSNRNTAAYRFRSDGNLQMMLFLYGMSVDSSRVGVLTPERQ